MQEGCAEIVEAARLAEQTGDEGLKLGLRLGLCLTNLIRGRFREVISATDAIVEHPPADPRVGGRIVGSSPYVAILGIRSNVLAYGGRMREALALGERTIDLAHEVRELELLGQAHYNYKNTRPRRPSPFSLREPRTAASFGRFPAAARSSPPRGGRLAA